MIESPTACENSIATAEMGRPEVEALFVDLDGTLVAGDVLRLAVGLAVCRRPWVLFGAPFALLWGRASLKRYLARRIYLDPKWLRYHDDVLDFLREQKRRGCRIVLATANDALWAEPIVAHVGLFDDLIASDGQRNLKGTAKLAAMQNYCQKHGLRTFGYAGDASADLPIWRAADAAYIVAPSRRTLAQLRKCREPDRIFGMGNTD